MEATGLGNEGLLARIEKGLWAPLPGMAAQIRMAVEPRAGDRP
jgi:hypothetical protein